MRLLAMIVLVQVSLFIFFLGRFSITYETDPKAIGILLVAGLLSSMTIVLVWGYEKRITRFFDGRTTKEQESLS